MAYDTLPPARVRAVGTAHGRVHPVCGHSHRSSGGQSRVLRCTARPRIVVVVALAVACGKKEPPPPAATAAPANPPASAVPPAPDPGRERVAKFIDWAPDALRDPTKQKYVVKPQCEEGTCEADYDAGDGRTYLASWAKGNPKSVRVFANFGDKRVPVSCESLKGILVRKWLYASATKYHCKLDGGTGVLIEQYGQDRPSAMNGTNLHFFTQAYVVANADFREVLETETSGQPE